MSLGCQEEPEEGMLSGGDSAQVCMHMYALSSVKSRDGSMQQGILMCIWHLFSKMM